MPVDDVVLSPASQQLVPYPCLEAHLLEQGVPVWGEGFRDLLAASDEELAGMGLALIGNVCRRLATRQVTPEADATLTLRLAPGVSRTLPWPGMPTDAPLPLDLTQLPFDTAMFLGNDDQKLRYRLDRVALMQRIQAVWVPALKAALVSYSG